MDPLIDLSENEPPEVSPKKDSTPSNTQLVQQLQALKSRNTTNLSKDEALGLAIEAAELQFKFMRLARSSSQQQDQMERSTQLLNQAENIKKSETWGPGRGGSLLDFNPLEPPKSSSSAVSTDQSQVGSDLKSCREITKHEEVILWRASTVNYSAARPWDREKEPQADEFALPPGQHLYQDKYHVRLSKDQAKSIDGWKRPKEALPPPNKNISKLSDVDYFRLKPTMIASKRMDLVQDLAYDCSFVASLCTAAARAERGHPEIISNIIYPHDQKRGVPYLSPNGRYVVKLNFNGCFRRVVIDDRLPVSKTRRNMHIADRNNPSLLWPALLEKAYLKIRGGYDFPGSNSGTDLWVLIGWIPEQVYFSYDEFDADDLWSTVWKTFESGQGLVTVGTGTMTEKAQQESGLARNHDYAVIDYREGETKESREILIKNPWMMSHGPDWVRGSRDGDVDDNEVTDGSKTSSKTVKASGGVTGAFWMSVNDVLQNFEVFYINWDANTLFKYRTEIHYAWDLSPSSAEANSADGSFIRNPQHVMTTDSHSDVWLLLTKHFQDRPRDEEGHFAKQPVEYISLYVFHSEGKRVPLSRGSAHHTPFGDAPQSLMKLGINPATPCTIVTAAEDMSERPHAFTLYAFSDVKLTLVEATPKYRERTSIRGSWTTDTAGGNANLASYSKNPQYSLRLPSASPVCILLETKNEAVKIHVRLVHGRGQRITAIASRDIIVDSGNYCPNTALAELRTELNAGTYTVVCGTYEAGELADFALTADSNVNASLNPILREGAGRFRLPLADASFASGVRKVACPVTPYRMCRLFIKATHGKPSSSPAGSSDPSASATPISPIRITIEERTSAHRLILIASAGGQFSDAAAGVKTEDVDLNPYMVSHARHGVEMWLVLERMGGFAGVGKPEENIKVDLFSDVEDPLQLGVWREVEF